VERGGTGEEIAVVGAAAVVGGGTVVAAAPSDDTGPILAFVGALLVAVLTAYTANRRQSAALAAERERLDAQLQHDRELADTADLRTVLEEALEAGDEMFEALLGVAAAQTAMQDQDTTGPGQTKEKRGDAEQGDGDLVDHELREAFEKAQSDLAAGMGRWSRATNQLQIRLVDDDPILEAHPKIFRVLTELRRVAMAGDMESFRKRRSEVTAHYRELVQAAKPRVGSRTANPSPPRPRDAAGGTEDNG
jgi:hypothetical protein